MYVKGKKLIWKKRDGKKIISENQWREQHWNVVDLDAASLRWGPMYHLLAEWY